MAKMIDQKPSFKGEAKVWEALRAYLPEDIVVYNNREINGREFDYCLFIENVGALIIEVKGWLSNKINVLGVDNIVVEGFEKPQRSPKKQARAYRFALLNKIVDKYNTSPLVFDMVCYPFITKSEYLSLHLDIISEEQFTIFKEDVENQDALMRKIQSAYDSSKYIPHADFDSGLIMKMRQDWEPDLQQDELPLPNISRVYSVLHAVPESLSDSKCAQIVDSYFSGTKEIIFVGDAEDYSHLSTAFNERFKKQNIQPSMNRLSIGYKTGLHIGKQSTRAFNLEIYLVNDLGKIIASPCVIEEGVLDGSKMELLKSLADATTFNFQQYMVEHASADKNTLVEAGAGTGKTYSMVARVAYLCNKKIGAISNIDEELAMATFTNDAANNMKVRLKQMFVNYFILTSNPRFLKFVEDTDRAHISTIHSFALDILRDEVLYSGLGTNFRISSNEYLRGKIYDHYLSEFLSSMEAGNPNFVNEIPVPIYDLKKKIMLVADKLLAKSINLESIKPSEMGIPVENTIPYFNLLIENVIIPSEKEYSSKSHLTNALDLRECIILLEKVLEQLPEKLDYLRLKYLFVDEFQDTDDVQIQVFQMLQKVINAECRMFVVGDLKQSIYRFRGAKLSAFKQMMSASLYGWECYHLIINYRTDRRLLDIYGDIFEVMAEQNYLPYDSNVDRLHGNIQTDLGNEELFISIPCHAKDEDTFSETLINVLLKQKQLLEEINNKREENHLEPLSREERTIAVLVRNNWQVNRIVALAKKKGIKIDTKSGGDLFQLESTLDLYKLLLAVTNSSNPVYLVNFIESNYVNLSIDYQKYHALGKEACTADLIRILDEFFEIRMQKSWQQVVNEAYTQPILFVLKHLYDALQPWRGYSYQFPEQKFYMANYEYLMERIIKYSRVDALTLNQVLNYLRVCILTGQQQSSREIEIDNESIQLICTTIHKSKGLEYGTVILPYTDEDISDPKKTKLDANYSSSKLSYTVTFENKIRERNSNYNETVEVGEQISEESRILYVALTRAIRNCVWIQNIDSKSTISWGSLMSAGETLMEE